MITRSPYSRTNAIKPGRIPEPIQPIHTCDPQWAIDLCLDCPVPGRCYPESSECPLNEANKQRETAHRPKTLERDDRILYLLTHGWKNTEAICEELHISKKVLVLAKRRLRERGEIT